MSQPPSNSPFNGRMLGFILGLSVFVSVTLIGVEGYAKYRLDRAEAWLAAPGSVLPDADDAMEKLRHALGYAGFTSTAQTYVASHNVSLLPDLKAETDAADDIIQHIPEKVPGDQRPDLEGILNVFRSALAKMQALPGDPNGFTALDMQPIYAVLPVLDDRVEGVSAMHRFEAQHYVQLWSMIMTLSAWCSLVLASGLAAGIYLTLRGRNSAPIRALAQSVKNMARGDMRSSIWGMERTDTVGELARAIDLARYHFSQLPDMSVMSDKGPLRLRFEGNTRSIFEAMMRVISHDSETLRDQSLNLTDAVHRQEQAIAELSARVEGVLEQVEQRGVDGDQQVQKVLNGIITSAQSLKNAQEHAADQLGRILPYMQERAQGMAEITQITGKHVSQMLNAMSASEHGLRSVAEHSSEAVKKLSSAADQLGERMFGAVNLLQASGRVLAETTEKTQSRLNEVIGQMDIKERANPAVDAVLSLSARLEAAALSVDAAQAKIAGELQDIAKMRQAPPEPEFLHKFVLELRTGFETIARQVNQMREQVSNMTLLNTPANLVSAGGDAAVPEHFYHIAGQIEGTRDAIERMIGQHMERIESKLAFLEGQGTAPPGVDPAAFSEAQQQLDQQSQILTEMVAALGVLDAHMQQLKFDITGREGRRAQG